MAVCVGRERELAFITSRLEATGAHGMSLVAVSGPAGIGKSAIVGELRERARLGGFAVLEGFCAKHSAFAPWSAITAQALAFLRARGEQEQLAPGDLEALAPLVSGRPPREREDDDEGGLRFAEALSRLIAAVGRVRPVLVLLRSFAQIDESSRGLLRTLLDSAGPVGEPTPGAPSALIVVANRADEALDLVEHPRVSVVSIEGLDLEGTRKLLNEDIFIQKIHSATGGSPNELLGILDRPPSARTTEAISRIQQLGDVQRSIVCALHAAARPLPVHVLAAATGNDPTVTARAVPALVDVRVVWRDLDGQLGDVVLGLVLHDDGAAAWQTLDEESQAKLEQRLGDALLDWGKVAPEESLAHLLRGRTPQASIGRVVDVCQTLLRRHAPATALRIAVQAGEYADAETLSKLAPIAAQAARGCGGFAEARALVDRARAQNAATSSDATLARISAELALAVGDLDACEAALVAARRGSELADDARAAIEAVGAEYAYQRGNLDEAERSAREAIQLSREEAMVNTQARNTLTKVFLWRGSLDQAWDWCSEHIVRARARGATTEVLRGIINLGVIAVRRGDLEDAARHFESARAIAARGGTMMMRGVLKENEAVLAHLRGRFGDALSLYQEALGILIRVGHRQFLARVANNLGELYVQVGETTRARRMCEYAAQVGRNLARGLVAEGLLLRGQIELAEGQHDAARGALTEALAMFAASGELGRAAEAHLLLARAALADGDTVRARHELEAVSDDEERTGLRVAAERAQVKTSCARAEGLDAVALSRLSLELAERAGDVDLELRAHVQCGLAWLERGEPENARKNAEQAAIRRADLLSRVNDTLRISYDAVLAKTGLARLESRLEIVAAEAKSYRTVALDRVTPTTAERGGLIGEGAAMSALKRLVARVAPADTSVLLRGETGTGKERVAEAIHRGSRRRAGPLIKVNCAAIAEGVLLSELFGHEKGAYTGAVGRRKGRFEAADGGTIFLDEIGDISASMQASLLRVLQEHTFERVGGNAPIRVDVRVIAATNKNLEEAMKSGHFRDDLYYRLANITVRLPPLRERLEDVPSLALHFLELTSQRDGVASKKLSATAMRRLCEYSWPGNIRELANVMSNALVLSDGDEITVEDLEISVSDGARGSLIPPPPALGSLGSHGGAGGFERDRSEVDVVYDRIRGGGVPLFEMRKEIEKGCIARALGESGGNITRAANLLGMKRPRLSQLVREYGLAKPGDPEETSES